MQSSRYPWFEVARGDVLEQGDILPDCPIFIAPGDLDVDALEKAASLSSVRFDCHRFDVIVMSQTCDLVKGREKVQEILLCPLFQRSDFETGELSRADGWEDARKGRFPAYHVIAACTLGDHPADPKVVDFRRVFSLPLSFSRNFASLCEERVRLLPPYRGHLSQDFARFFMRVGLPVDIPPFK